MAKMSALLFGHMLIGDFPLERTQSHT